MSWDEWVEGDENPIRPKKNWLKIITVIVALLALGGLLTAMFIELGLG